MSFSILIRESEDEWRGGPLYVGYLVSEDGVTTEWTDGTDLVEVTRDTMRRRDELNSRAVIETTEAQPETREEATARFHKYWREFRPSSFLEVFLEGARVK